MTSHRPPGSPRDVSPRTAQELASLSASLRTWLHEHGAPAPVLAMGERGDGYLYRPTYRDRHGQKRSAAIWWWRISIRGRKHAMATGHTDKRQARAWAIKRLAELLEGDTSALSGAKVTLARLERLVRDDYAANGLRSIQQVGRCFRHLTRLLCGREHAVEGKRRRDPLPHPTSRITGPAPDRVLVRRSTDQGPASAPLAQEPPCAQHVGTASVPCTHVKAKDITSAAMAEYAARRQAEGAKPGTINLETGMVRRAFRLAARLELLPAKAAGWTGHLRENNARQGFLERPAFDAIQAQLPEDVRGAFLVGYLTGWRFESEILTRQWRHVDLAAGWLRLEPGEPKERYGRMFPLTPEMRSALEAQRAYTDAWERDLGGIIPWVFHRCGAPIRSLRKVWARARAKAGYPRAMIHDFRRTNVRNMERSGVPRSTAMKLIGHKTERIYSRYAIVDEVMLREGVGKLAVLQEQQRQEAAKVVPISAGRRKG